MSADRIDTTPGPDPSDLPLFATLPAQRPGRVRGSFSMNPTPTPIVAATAPHGNGHGHGNGHAGLVARPLPRPFAGELDWPLVAALRQQASDRLSAALGEDRTRTTSTDQRSRGRAIIIDLLEAEAAERIGAGVPTWSATEQDALVALSTTPCLGSAGPAAGGRRDRRTSSSPATIRSPQLSDGRLIPGPPVADTDAELIDFLRSWPPAARSTPDPSPRHNPDCIFAWMAVPAWPRRRG